jgi:hypothetical protein
MAAAIQIRDPLPITRHNISYVDAGSCSAVDSSSRIKFALFGAITDADWSAIEMRLTEAYEILKREVLNGRPGT